MSMVEIPMQYRQRGRLTGILLGLLVLQILIAAPLAASTPESLHPAQKINNADALSPPSRIPITMDDRPWWETTNLDRDRDKIHDSILQATGPVNVGISYDHKPAEEDVERLAQVGHVPRVIIESIDVILIGTILPHQANSLAELPGVVMVERYGVLTFYGDVQTPAVKARSSALYPVGAWDLGVSGEGVNIAMVDTGADDEHPALAGKFVAGYDAVCYLHTDPTCVISGTGTRETDGSFNPDDGNQHGTACMGMAASTGLDASGQMTNFTGAAPNASLVDVRIGTDIGAGPFENYAIEQQFYESAMNGIDWIIENKDTAWSGIDEANHGIDIISLSWGITSHEAGGSDGQDMHSRILDTATEAGITVSVAAGNDGPDNDGFSGMGSSDLSITVGATDDINTINRTDDVVADYSSRGPRRDDGDTNPVDELKPTLSAPGTDIVQAEACVTSGGCNNNLGQDASDNGYTPRGSGTSYATPSVSGVIALMIEANPELEPLVIRESLKSTAERRGEASAPNVDPYWNRDFGWGMVDAHAAVQLVLDMNESNIDLASIDVALQAHVDSITTTPSEIAIHGRSWAQVGSIEQVVFRIDQSNWGEATYESENGTVPDAMSPFNWTIRLNPQMLEVGERMVEIRAVSGLDESGEPILGSLPTILSIQGTGAMMDLDGHSGLVSVTALVTLVAVGISTWFAVSARDRGEETIEEAILEDDA